MRDKQMKKARQTGTRAGAAKPAGETTNAVKAGRPPADRGPAQRAQADDYNITRQVGHLLRKAYQTHMAIFQSLSSNPQITPMQFAVMCVLKDHGPCSLTVIGRHIVMDLATVRGIAERLAQRGFVSYSRDDADRRQVIARLEPAGREVVEKMIPSARQISEATVQQLTVAERVALNYLLEKISATDINAAQSTSSRPIKAELLR